MTAITFSAREGAMSDLSANAYRLFEFLAMRADHRGVAWPGMDKISEKVGVCDNTARERIGECVTAGYVRYLRKDAVDPLTGRKEGNVYIINPIMLLAASEEGKALWASAETVGSLPTGQSESSLKNCGRQEQLQKHLQKQGQEHTTHNSLVYFGSLVGYRWRGRVVGFDSDESEKESENEKYDGLPLFKFGDDIQAGTELFRQMADQAGKADRPRDGLADRLAYWQIAPQKTQALVSQFGIELVEQAYTAVNTRKDVKSPAGMLDWYLKNPTKIPRVKAQVDALTDTSRYVSGEFAQFISY